MNVFVLIQDGPAVAWIRRFLVCRFLVCRGLACRGLIRDRLAEQVPEQHAVVDHRLPEILGRRGARRGLTADGRRRPIVIKCLSVLDRKIRENLAAIIGGVATLGHDLDNHQVRIADGFLRPVYESFLDACPLINVLRTSGGIQWANIKALDPPFPLGEFGLGLPATGVLLDHAVIFRAEALAEPPSACLGSYRRHCRHHNNDDDNGHDDPS